MASDPHAYALDGFRTVNRPHACVLVIFGASGDLTKRKLIPALYNLALEKLLPERFAVVGYARSAMTHESFRESMREAVKKFSRTGLKDETVWRQFANTLYYVPGTYEEHDGYQSLKDFVEGFDGGSRMRAVRVFYMAIPPDLYGTVIERIAAVGLVQKESDGEPRARVVIEKVLPLTSCWKTRYLCWSSKTFEWPPTFADAKSCRLLEANLTGFDGSSWRAKYVLVVLQRWQQSTLRHYETVGSR